jgi:hypothetical protein
MVREVASNASGIAGGVTSNATVFGDTIVREGAKAVAAGEPVGLKRGIDLAVADAVSHLERRSKKIKTWSPPGGALGRPPTVGTRWTGSGLDIAASSPSEPRGGAP